MIWSKTRVLDQIIGLIFGLILKYRICDRTHVVSLKVYTNSFFQELSGVSNEPLASALSLLVTVRPTPSHVLNTITSHYE